MYISHNTGVEKLKQIADSHSQPELHNCWEFGKTRQLETNNESLMMHKNPMLYYRKKFPP